MRNGVIGSRHEIPQKQSKSTVIQMPVALKLRVCRGRKSQKSRSHFSRRSLSTFGLDPGPSRRSLTGFNNSILTQFSSPSTNDLARKIGDSTHSKKSRSDLLSRSL